MAEKTYYRLAVLFSVLALAVFVIDVSVITGNKKIQNEVAERQNIINQGVEQSKINQALVQGLADIASKSNDKDITSLLAAQGVTFKPLKETSVDKAVAPASEKK